MAEEVKVPELGESVTEATIGTWMKKVGDAVKRDEPIVELETDKVAMEVNAPADGVISELVVDEGDTVEVGALIAKIDTDGKAASSGDSKKADAKADDQAEKKDKQEDQPNSAPKSSAKPKASGEAKDLVVPELGESITEAVLGRWIKAEGETVAKDEPVAELETDKVAMEVNSPVDGVMTKHLASEGDTVEIGKVIGKVTEGGATQADSGTAGASEKKQPESKSDDEAASPTPKAAKDDRAETPDLTGMAPSVRRLIEDYNLDPASINGSGKDGRLTKADVLSAIENGTAKTLRVPTAQPAAGTASIAASPAEPREERVAMTRMRKRIAERLKDAQNTAAMLTTYNDVDMGEVMKVRGRYKDMFEKKHGIRLGFMSFFTKACCLALREVPAVNARIDGDEIVYQNFYDIGVAVSAPTGLVVPVLRNADKISFADTETTIADFGRRARDGNLKLSEMQGGTFTITNGGVFGSLMSSPILNPPQVGILGMHRIEERPVVRNGEIVIRPMMYLALSYDHRLIDGREAVTFLVRVKEAIEDPQRLLIDM